MITDLDGKPVTIGYDDITSIAVGNNKLQAGVDYEIVSESYKNNIEKGKASVQLRGIGNYGGECVVNFSTDGIRDA